MPHVGDKKFPYTKTGKEDAKKAAKKTGKKLKYDVVSNTHRPMKSKFMGY